MFYVVVSSGCVQCQEEAHVVEQTVQNIKKGFFKLSLSTILSVASTALR